MLPKLILVLLLVAVVISLFTSLYFMFHDRGKSKRMVNTLMIRVILSFALIAYVVVAYLLGWIHPHGVGR